MSPIHTVHTVIRKASWVSNPPSPRPPLPLQPLYGNTWVNLARDVTSCCYCQVMQANAHRLHFAYRWPGWPVWPGWHSWHWPRSTVTPPSVPYVYHTYPAYGRGATELCSRTFAAVPSLDHRFWPTDTTGIAGCSSVQLLAHRRPDRERETERPTRAESGKKRINILLLRKYLRLIQ